ncbi:MAG: 5'-methylthioadenosine/adenosylhomocysteine nucleosidase, partial [Burkholderiales bacterium]
MTSREAPVAIVAAMREELRALLPLLSQTQLVVRAGREFHRGLIHGRRVVLTRSGIGKVAAATTATLLAAEFAPSMLLFTGVAGGLAHYVRVGDVVLARELLQHDMDASPLFPRYEVPLTGRARFAVDTALADRLAIATESCLRDVPREVGASQLAAFGIERARLHQGLVISGDRFVSTVAESAALRQALRDALAVEMEGAAVAQVCADFGL